MSSVAILGAGSSGLAAAQTLREAGYSVTLFEKSRGVGGRAATRRREGFLYDHGAQYVKSTGGALGTSWITERFRSDDLITIDKPVWTFDDKGHITEGDPRQNMDPKWSYRSGLTSLAHRMAQGLTIHFQTRVAALHQHETGWSLRDTKNADLGHFERVLISIPASQASELVEASTLHSNVQASIISHLQRARYHRLLSVMLGYRPTPLTRPYYALVNTDKAHAISWLAWEHEKTPERVPPGSGLLIAQMAPAYSLDHWETPDETLIPDVAAHVARLIGEDLPQPIFWDSQRWRYALPATTIDADALHRLTLPLGLAFCGDAFVGGRIQLALEHGIQVAQQLIKGAI